MKTKMNNSQEWLLRKAAEEDNCPLSVGGLTHELGVRPVAGPPVPLAATALSKLVELRRRELGMSVEQLAEGSKIDVAEVVSIEEGIRLNPEPRTIYNLAGTLRLSSKRLMELAGLVEVRDEKFSRATVKFAAQSEPMEKLTKEEREALQEFVRFFAEA